MRYETTAQKHTVKEEQLKQSQAVGNFHWRKDKNALTETQPSRNSGVSYNIVPTYIMCFLETTQRSFLPYINHAVSLANTWAGLA